ncbi:MAG: WD40/YVTN/BNR-like repeat-containing protein, partial [Gemmatimonadota bacterium]
MISPDLTSDDPELQRRTGGLTLDDAGPTIGPVVFAIAESPLEEGLLWAGTNDGLVQVTRDGGATWEDVTSNLPGLPPRGTVSNIEPSRHAAGTAYVTVDRHQLGDFDPYVYRTADFGRHWTRIDAAIPRSVFSYAHCVREDPAQPGLLYLGTENGVWVSFDDGAGWHSLQSNLPHAPVHWLVVQEQFADLVLATYGRGFWILDDITPLRALAARVAARAGEDGRSPERALVPREPVLFAPRPAYRFRSREEAMSQPGDPAAGRNPEYGASLHYSVPEGLPEDTELSLRIIGAGGDTVYTFDDPDGAPGLHRIHWNLRTDATRQPRLRTPPDENPHVPLPARGWRAMPDGGRLSLLVPPDRYTVRLGIGEAVRERTLEVRRDPTAPGSIDGIRAAWPVLRDLYAMLERAALVIDEIEWLRRQLADIEARLREAEPTEGDSVPADVSALETGLKGVEGRLFDLRHTGAGQDGLRWRRLLYARIASLARDIGGTDEPPTEPQLAVRRLLGEELAEVEERFAALRGRPLADLNRA